MTKWEAIKKFKETQYITLWMEKVLKEVWIINGIWNDKFPVWKLLRANIPFITSFNKDKLSSLLDTIETKWSNYHDVRTYIWWWIVKFYVSNLKFAYTMYKIFKWTSKTERILIFIVCFFILNVFWKQFFNFK